MGPPRRRILIREDLTDVPFAVSPDTEVVFVGVTSTRVDFRQQRFAYFSSEYSTFIDCDFQGATLAGVMSAGQHQSVFRRCKFDRAKLLYVTPRNARFENCSFLGVTIKKWFTFCTEFVSCTFSGRIETCFGRPLGTVR